MRLMGFDTRWTSFATVLLLAAASFAADEALPHPHEAAAGSPPPARTTACAGEPRSTAFDYWLGAWDVRPYGGGLGAPLHRNEVTLEQDGCVLQEHWRSAPHPQNGQYTGTSFTMFDAKRELWHQTWVDNVGGLALFEGKPDARGDLVLERVPAAGERPDTSRTRMSYRKLDDGGVRQVVERSTDGGATWTTTIDLHYVRRPASAPRPSPGR